MASYSALKQEPGAEHSMGSRDRVSELSAGAMLDPGRAAYSRAGRNGLKRVYPRLQRAMAYSAGLRCRPAQQACRLCSLNFGGGPASTGISGREERITGVRVVECTSVVFSLLTQACRKGILPRPVQHAVK